MNNPRVYNEPMSPMGLVIGLAFLTWLGGWEFLLLVLGGVAFAFLLGFFLLLLRKFPLWIWSKVSLAPMDAPPLHTPQSNEEDVSPDQADTSPISATTSIDQSLQDVVTSRMTCIHIVTVLASHGCTDLTYSLNQRACSPYPIVTGGLSDVFYGRLLNGMAVAIKTIRADYDQGQLARMYHKRAAKEIYIWSKCKHPNVVELIGLAVFRGYLAMISKWEENGNLSHYLSKRPSVDRCQLSISICAGLVYLHRNDIVHGDLKGANILIAEDGRPMLVDFGNASLLAATLQFTQTTTGPNFTPRWTAPEILRGTTKHTTAGDVYSLGMTILETFTSEIPFADKLEQSLLVHIVLEKETPTRPETIIPSRSTSGNKLWDILTRCWAWDPEDRPSAVVVWDEMKPITPDTLKELETESGRGDRKME